MPSPWHTPLKSIAEVLDAGGSQQWTCPCTCDSLASNPGSTLVHCGGPHSLPNGAGTLHRSFPSFSSLNSRLHTHSKHTQRVRRDMRTYCLRQFRRVAAQDPARTFSTSASLRRAFKEGDVVLLREKKELVDGKLVKLQASKSIHTHRGVIEHANVIGKEPRQIVRSSKGSEYRVLTPTLAEYVRLTPRLVTPVRLLSPENALQLRCMESKLSITSCTPLTRT